MIENYIIPVNIKLFNLFAHLEKTDEFTIRKTGALKNGDNVFIYLSAPYSEIRFMGEVIQSKILEEDLDESCQYAIPKRTYLNKDKKFIFMKIKITKTFEKDFLPLEKLKEHGLGQVQLQARTDRKLQAFIDIALSTLS